MKKNLIKETVCDVLTKEGEEIFRLTETLDYEQAAYVAEAIKNCSGTVVFSACGTSAQAARKSAHTLCCIGCPALFIPPSDALHGGLGIIRENDLLILISKGGCTREINQMIEPARKTGAVVIMVTENEEGSWAKKCDGILTIRVSREPDPFNMLATSSTLAVIAAFDAITIWLMKEKEYTKDNFARIHPEGEVGKRLAEEES